MNNLDRLTGSTAIRPCNDDALREPTPSDLVSEILALRSFLSARAFLLTQEASAADDLVQDTFERALAARVSFRPGTNLKAWLSVILKRRFIDGRRHAQAGHRLHRELERAPVEEQSFEELDPIELLDVVDVVRVLGHLSARDREVFDLFHLRRLSYQQIAERLGVPISTVGTRLLRAKRRVRTKLEDTLELRRVAFEASAGAPSSGAAGA